MTGTGQAKVERPLVVRGDRPRMFCPICGRNVASKKTGAPVRHHRPGYEFDENWIPQRHHCPAGEDRR